jgi:hypothetical protein
MKSVKSLIDPRQEIEQQLHAVAMRQLPSQTVKSPDGHLVIHAPFDIQDLKKRVRLKSQLAQIDLKPGPAKPVKKSVPQRTPTITNGGCELLTEQMLAQRWFCSTSWLQRWRMDERGSGYLKIGGKVLHRLEDVRLYELSCRVKTAAIS